MNRGFGNLIEQCDIGVIEAAKFTATNAAAAMGMSEDIGSIEPGKWADITVLDADYNCVATFVAGRKLYGV